MTIGQALEAGILQNETIAYFIGRTALFAQKIGLKEVFFFIFLFIYFYSFNLFFRVNSVSDNTKRRKWLTMPVIAGILRPLPLTVGSSVSVLLTDLLSI